jgi:hypothetical protein
MPNQHYYFAAHFACAKVLVLFPEQFHQALNNGTMDQAEAVAKVKAWRPIVA